MSFVTHWSLMPLNNSEIQFRCTWLKSNSTCSRMIYSLTPVSCCLMSIGAESGDGGHYFANIISILFMNINQALVNKASYQAKTSRYWLLETGQGSLEYKNQRMWVWCWQLLPQQFSTENLYMFWSQSSWVYSNMEFNQELQMVIHCWHWL